MYDQHNSNGNTKQTLNRRKKCDRNFHSKISFSFSWMTHFFFQNRFKKGSELTLSTICMRMRANWIPNEWKKTQFYVAKWIFTDSIKSFSNSNITENVHNRISANEVLFKIKHLHTQEIFNKYPKRIWPKNWICLSQT